jgi:hypothetical protein
VSAKSALIRRFIAGLDGHVKVVRGSCDPLATPRPLGPLIDMLPQLAETRGMGVEAATVQRVLRHSSISVTTGTNVDVIEQVRRSAVAGVDSLLDPAK